MTKKAEGAGEITIYFDPVISDETKVIFIRYVHDHLKAKALNVVRVTALCVFKLRYANRKPESGRGSTESEIERHHLC